MTSQDRMHPLTGLPLKGRRTKKKSVPPALDLNPMSDLAFQLIIFFMLATTFSRPQTMEIVMPVKPTGEDKEQPVKESKALTLMLHANNAIIYYSGITDPEPAFTDYSASGLRQLILDKNAITPELIILIKPHSTSNYENLIDVLDEMAIAHTGRYAIVDITEADEAIIESFLQSENRVL